jgi:hypothetical protein
MTNIIKRINSCRICNSKNLIYVYKNESSPIGEAFVSKPSINLTQRKYPINLLLCKRCGLSQLQHTVDPKVLYLNYLYETKSSYYLKLHFKNLANYLIKKYNLNNSSFVIDIGSNDGTLLNNLKKKKIKVLGIEPATKIAQLSKKKNIPTVNNFFSQELANKIKKKYGPADLILANNVFANVHNINDWMKGIDELLNEKGTYVFESYYLKSLLKNKVFDFIYHEHISSFSLRPIIFLAKKYNMTLFDCEKISSKGGSLRYHITKRNIKKTNRLKKEIYSEKLFNLYSKKNYNYLLKKKKIMKKKFELFLNKKKNINLIGLGASISCITLIYDFKIEDKFKYLLDDNKIKTGLFSPGTNIKVLSLKNYKPNKDDVFVLLAWRFRKILLSKYRYLFQKNLLVDIWPKFKTSKM